MAASEDSGMIPPPPGPTPSAPGGQGAINPMALSVAQLARVLAVPEEKVREHVAAGAPLGADGTISLVVYAAWLNRQLARTDGD